MIKQKITYLEPKDIICGTRFRQDLGDLSTLISSILAKGILQPITIATKTNELIAGGRRYAAYIEALEADPDNPYVKQGIPVIHRTIVDEQDLREIELMENTHRKDMTWHEEAALTKAIHTLMKEKNPTHTQQDTADIIGVDRSRISQHIDIANAIEVLPDLSKAPNEDTARKLFNKTLETAQLKKLKAEHDKNNEGAADNIVSKLTDSYDIEDCIVGMKRIRKGAWHFAEVDPPYAIDLQGKKTDASANIEHYNEVDVKDYPTFLKDVMTALYNVLADDAWVVWWFGPTHHTLVIETLREVGFKVDDIPCIWVKEGSPGVSTNPDVNLARAYEPFFVCRKGTPLLRRRGRGNTFTYKPVSPSKKRHPTQRPIMLIQDILETFCFPGARVLVPFLGSGTTLLAAHECGMGYTMGFELSEDLKIEFEKVVHLEYGEK